MNSGRKSQFISDRTTTVLLLPARNSIRFYREPTLAETPVTEIPVGLRFPMGKIQTEPLPRPKPVQKPAPFIFRTPSGEKLSCADSFAEFVLFIRTGSIDSVLHHAKNKEHFFPWLQSLGHQEAAERLAGFAAHYEEIYQQAESIANEPREFLRGRLLSIFEPLLSEEDKRLISLKLLFGNGPAIIHAPTQTTEYSTPEPIPPKPTNGSNFKEAAPISFG